MRIDCFNPYRDHCNLIEHYYEALYYFLQAIYVIIYGWRIKTDINLKSSLGTHFSTLCGCNWYIYRLHNQRFVSEKYLVVFQVQVVKGSIHGKMLIEY